MVDEFKTKAKECLDNADYEGYFELSQKQYNLTKDDEDLENLEKSKKLLHLSKKIQEILQKEGQNSYKILEIDQNSTIPEIKKAFREKASIYHPTRAPVKGAEDAFRLIQEAYFEINTEEKKKEYDNRLKGGRTFFNTIPVQQTAYYNPNPFQNFYSFSSGSDGFVFYNATPAFFANNMFDSSFANIYSNLYRNTQQRRTTRRDPMGIYFSILFFLILLLLNFLS